MSIEKIREEFELAYVANIQEKLGGPIPKGVLDEYVVRGSDGEYRSYQAQGAWWGWQASRESLVVELPEEFDDGTVRRMRVVRILENAGVNVK